MGLPVDEQRVRDAEVELGRDLPSALRERLMREDRGQQRR